MMDFEGSPGGRIVFKGTCGGPVFGECGEEIRRTYTLENAPDSPFIRFRCPECESIVPLDKVEL